MAFNPEIDKISINELNDDLKKKINTNYESTEGLKEDFDNHVADVPHETDTDYKTSHAKHVISAERTYWNSLEASLKAYTDTIIGQLPYETVAKGLAAKVENTTFNVLVGTDWEERTDQTLRNIAFTGEYADVHNAPAVDDENNIIYAKTAKNAEIATNAVQADNASMSALSNFATTAEKSYDAYQVNSCITVVHDIVPTTAYIKELIGNTGISVTTVLWVDSVNFHIQLCLNFMSYNDDNRVWHQIN